MAKRLEQLKKVKMPSKPMGAKEAEQDLDMELGPEAEAEGESMDMEKQEKDMPEMDEGDMGEMGEQEDPMAQFDDQMILEEMKKRGLTMDDLNKEPEDNTEMPE